ncbi:MAG: hypothetical protein WC488_00520 [Candidatus Micrarchaeia archaeon]
MLKTTVLLREDVYEMLVREFGKRNVSKGINEYLFEHMFTENQKDMFAKDKWLQKAGTRDLRDHHERDL